MSFNKNNKMRKNLVIAFLSIALAFGSSTFAVYGQTDYGSLSKDDLIRLISQLLAQQGGSSSQNNAVSSAQSVGCSYTFTRNLSLGSSGADVKKLQEFLNTDSSTLVAVSGAGSKGRETNYFGPATKRAVAKFQNKYASEVLAPYGLTSGTGYFGPSTKSKANKVCSAQANTAVTSTSSQGQVGTPVQQTPSYNQNFVASGSTLAVNTTQQPANGIAVGNAQRLPYTNIVLTAGSSDVLVEGIRVKLQGVTKRDNFNGIAVIDASGAQLGTARSLRSDSSVVVGGRFYVGRGTSVTLTVIGNVAASDSGASISGVGQLQVTEVLANTVVTGNFPISGAQHTFSDALTLGGVEIESTVDGTGDVEIGDTNVKFADYTLELDTEGDEDAYLRSITFEQKGSSSDSDVSELSVRVDGRNSYKPTVSGDRYTVVFPAPGVFIEEGDRIDVSIEGTVTDGYDRTVRFDIDDVSDVYVVGASRGYGLPVTDEDDDGVDNGKVWTVKAGDGKTSSERFLSSSAQDIRADNDQIIGAFELEVTAEEIDVEDTSFTLTIDNNSAEGLFGFRGTQNEFTRLEISDVKIVDYNSGRVLADADEYKYIEPVADNAVDNLAKTVTFEFDSTYTLPVGELEIVITADLESNFQNATKFTISEFEWGTAEGVVTGKTISSTELQAPTSFSDFTIDGDEFSISIARNVESLEVVRGSEGVEFAIVEFDASDSKEDIEYEEVYLDVTLGGNADISDLDNCVLVSPSGDEIGEYSSGARALSDTSGIQFVFDDVQTVTAGEIADVSVRCDVDDDAVADGTYQFSVDTSTKVDYRIDNDRESLTPDADSARAVTIKSEGDITEAVQADSDKNVAVGDSGTTKVGVGAFELSADRENFNINEVTVLLNAGAASEEDYVVAVELEYNGKIAREVVNGSDASGVSLVFDGLGWVIDDSRKASVDVSLELNSLADGDASGVAIDVAVTGYEPEGEDSNLIPTGKDSISLALGGINVYKSLPTFAASKKTTSLSSGTETLYQFEVSADQYDVALNKVTTSISPSNVTFAANSVKLYAFTDSSRNNRVSEADSEGLVSTLTTTPSSSAPTSAFTFTNPVFIDEGATFYFEIRADVTVATGTSSIVTKLVGESFADASAAVAAGSVTGNIVFSPNTSGGVVVTTSTTDWFAAKGSNIVSTSNFNEWNLSKE